MSDEHSIIRRIDESGVPLLLVRLLIGGLFIYMGVQKIGHPGDFLKQIHLYGLLPERPPYFLNGTAIVLPWLEVLCGAALILGVWLRGAALSVAAMLLVFTPAIFLRAMAIHAAKGTPFMEIAFDCGCGGGAVIIWQKLLQNTSLFLVTLLALLSRSRRFCLGPLLGRSRPAMSGNMATATD